MPAQSTAASDSRLESLADNIRDARKRQALTQADLALRAGISVSFISMIERGERAPSYETLFAVAKGLQVPVAQLFATADAEPVDYGPYRSLVDWARNAHLSRSQVDRLIAAGRAMFGVEGPARKTEVKEAPSADHLCTATGCKKPVLAKGLCVGHYREKLRKAQR